MPTLRRAPKKAMSHKAGSSPRIVSSDEKRQLILAHAARRQPVDPVQRMSLWAGVFVCVVFVVGAWFYTVGSGIRNTMASTSERMRGRIPEPMDTFPGLPENIAADPEGRTLQDGFKEVEERLDDLTAEQQLIEAMAAQISSSTATSTQGLFKPQEVTSTTDTSDADTSDSTISDPETP